MNQPIYLVLGRFWVTTKKRSAQKYNIFKKYTPVSLRFVTGKNRPCNTLLQTFFKNKVKTLLISGYDSYICITGKISKQKKDDKEDNLNHIKTHETLQTSEVPNAPDGANQPGDRRISLPILRPYDFR